MNITATQELNIKLVNKEVLEDGSIKAFFEIEPLERGFGITLGNTLRRICLSHLEGLAVYYVKIPGVTHEFSTIKGVLEDVVEIILNCKSLSFRSELAEPFVVSCSKNSIGPVLAKDLVLPAGVEVVNENTLIATLTEENMDFSIEIGVSKGQGYVLADEHANIFKQQQSVDTIWMDSAYMPIKKFAYKVEQTRIGESSEASSSKYEKLVLEMVSDGAMEPDRALSMASKLLLQRLTPFMNLTGETLPMFTPPVQEEEEEEDFSDVGIEVLNLSVRSYNCLKRAGKDTLGHLLQMTTDELMGIRNFGKKSAEEVIRILNERGFYLIDDSRRLEAEKQKNISQTPQAPFMTF